MARTTPSSDKVRLSGRENMRRNKLRKKNPNYPDKILRDRFGPPPGKPVRKVPDMPLYQNTIAGFLKSNDGSPVKKKKK